jgi:hypothetical protein
MISRMATCHPWRRSWTADGHCKQCEPRTLRLVEDAAAPPRECPHCHATPPGWQIGREASHCVYCGQWWDRRWTVVGA